MFNQGVESERNRIKALDEINNQSRAEVVNRAKYETFATVNEVAIELLNAEPVAEDTPVTGNTTQVENLINDALQASNTIETVPTVGLQFEESEEDKTLKVINRVLDAMPDFKR